MGRVPSPIGIDELEDIGIELDIFGIDDIEWLAAADGCPDEQAAAASASTPMPTAPWKTAPGRGRPGDEDLDMDRPPQAPAPSLRAP
jgi:hypothetical protein